MTQKSDAFAKKPLRGVRYSGKEFIQDIFPGFRNDEIELPGVSSDDDEARDDEENYDLYFPRHDSF